MAFTVSVDVKLIDNITRQLRSVSKEFERAGQAARRASQGFRDAGQAMTRVGRGLTLFVTAPIVALGVSSVLTAAKMQRMEISLSALMGSAKAAKTEMSKLIEVAKLPGLGVSEVVDASIKFQSAGLSADKARESILALGNAVALAGGGKAEFNRAMLQLSQIRNKATGFGQDLKALTESLPLLGAILEEAFGTRATDQISELGFTGEQVFKKMIDAMKGLPNVGKSLANSIENLGDAFFLFQVRIGESINELFNLEERIEKLGDFLRDVAERFAKLSPGMKKFIVFAALAAAALGPIVIALGLLLGAIGGILAGIAAMKIIFLAIAPFLPLILGIATGLIAMGVIVKAMLPAFKAIFIDVWKAFKAIAIPVMKIFLALWPILKVILIVIGAVISGVILVGLFGMLSVMLGFISAALIAASLLEKIGSFLGFNTEGLKEFIKELKIAADATLQAGETIIKAPLEALFAPTNNINIENNIELNQDKDGIISVAAVSSNAQTSTVKTINRGLMTPTVFA